MKNDSLQILDMNIDLVNILRELKTGLEKIYGERLRKVLLFGSYARDEQEEGSDIDVAVVLDGFAYIDKEIEVTGELVSSLSLKYDVLISILPIRESDWYSRNSALLLNLRQERVVV